MGGGGGGGNDGGYDAAPQRQAEKQRAQKQEEQRLETAARVTGEQSYAKTEGGSIVRGGSGSGVMTSAGVERAEASRQQDLMEATTGTEVGRQTIREGAIYELEKRKEKQLIPGTVGAIAGVISRANLDRQIEALKEGGDPTKVKSSNGNYVTVGVTTKDGESLGRPAADGGTVASIRGASEEQQPDNDIQPKKPPVVTPDETEEDAAVAAEEETIMTRGRKRTRGKRAGQGGTLLEGYGSLYRGGSSKGVSS
jgi:hypothetical protein